MVRIRLKRIGRKNLAIYKVIIADSRTKRDGKEISILGTYFPHLNNIKEKFKINIDKYNEWINKGAQPSKTVSLLFLKISNSINLNNNE